MFTLLIELLFSWLPNSLWFGVWAVMAVAFFVIMIKILSILLNFLTKIFGLFL